MTSGWRGEIGQAGSRSGQVRWVPLPPGYEAGTAAVGGFQSEQAATAPPIPSPASGCGLACGLKNATKDPTRPIALARLCLTFYNAGLPAPGRSLANAASCGRLCRNDPGRSGGEGVAGEMDEPRIAWSVPTSPSPPPSSRRKSGPNTRRRSSHAAVRPPAHRVLGSGLRRIDGKCSRPSVAPAPTPARRSPGQRSPAPVHG
jgi:hypothetical protein